MVEKGTNYPGKGDGGRREDGRVGGQGERGDGQGDERGERVRAAGRLPEGGRGEEVLTTGQSPAGSRLRERLLKAIKPWVAEDTPPIISDQVESQRPSEIVKSPVLSEFPQVVQATSTLAWGTMRLKEDDGSLRPSAERLEALANRRRFLESLGLNWERVVWMEQMHGNAIAVVGGADLQPGVRAVAGVDGLITREEGLALVCVTADCPSVCFYDPEAGIVGVAHAGWQGIVKGILPLMVTRMQRLGCKPANIRASIGPAIGSCCYEVSQAQDQRVELVRQITPAAVRVEDEQVEGGRTFLSLQKAAWQQLGEAGAGLLPPHIDVSPYCTCCEKGRFPSAYRQRYRELRPGRADSMLTVMARRKIA